MKNITALLLVLMLLLILPSGFSQVHRYIQEKDNVRHVTADLVKYLSKRGTLRPSTSGDLVNTYLDNQIAKSALRLNRPNISVTISRADALSDQELTAYDNFKVSVRYPKPPLLAWIDVISDLDYTLYGTMEPVPHYKETQ